jgi:hypothetical protein
MRLSICIHLFSQVLHRLVAAVIVRTGFASTLYTSSELAAATSSAAGASDFVDRIVAVLGVCEGEPIDLQVSCDN